jgi:hypothetical protein
MENEDLIFCGECMFYKESKIDGVADICGVGVEDITWYGRVIEHLKCYAKNKNNDCKDFKKKIGIFEKIKRSMKLKWRL